MTKRLLLTILATGVLLSSGCLFSRKSKSRTKTDSGAMASETERDFHQRWITRRVTELGAQGVSGPAAQQQAEQEYQQKYSFSKPLAK